MDDVSLGETLDNATLGVSSGSAGGETLLADTALSATHFDDVPGAAAAAATALRRSTILPRPQAFDDDTAALVVNERDRYEARGDLGTGAAGEVVLVRDNDIERDVAKKRLRHRDAAAVARFVDEIRTVGSLEHPNIVPIHDVGQDPDGAYYFIMKYVEGETLEQIIERLAAGDPDTHARYPFDVRTRIFLEILRAVQFAHARGIIHRDLKPANIMVGAYGEVMVMDWGLARRLDDAPEPSVPSPLADADADAAPQEASTSSEQRRRLFATRHGSLLGTPAYMSPEQAEGRNDEVDQRSDIYALGVIFHELVTLRHYLAERTTLQGLLLGVVSETPSHTSMDSSPHQPRVPVELVHFCRHALAKDPAARYPSVAAMSHDLQRRIAGEFAVECPLTFYKRLQTRFVHSFDCSPMVVAGLSLLLAALCLASLGFSVYTLLG